MSDVQSPATIVAYTPTGPVLCCARHAQALVRVLEAMGCFAVCGPAVAEAECNNCVNESNGQPRPHNGGTREVLPQGEVK